MGVDPVEFERSVADYLDSKQVYALFEELLVELALHMPEDPLSFLIDCLKRKPKMRVFIFGCEGVESDELCRSVAMSLGFEYVSASKLSTSMSALSPSFDSDMAGKVWSESLQKLEEDDSVTGYIVHGFPKNRAQGRCMQQQWPILPTRVIHLKRSHSEEDLNLPGLLELFKNITREVFLDVGSAKEEISRLLQTPKVSLAPSRPRRICVLGGDCARLAMDYGLVLVEKPGNFLSEEELFRAIQARLSQADCRRSGWVLSEFPLDEVQGRWLRDIYPGYKVISTNNHQSVGEVGKALPVEVISVEGLTSLQIHQKFQECVEKC